jgi:heme-degrading monooxygenase HmoA
MDKAAIAPHAQVATVVNVFTVQPEKQGALVEALAKTTNEVMRNQPGFISVSIHASSDGTKVLAYGQWESEADLRAVVDNPADRERLGEAQKLAEGFEPRLYTVESVHHR